MKDEKTPRYSCITCRHYKTGSTRCEQCEDMNVYEKGGWEAKEIECPECGKKLRAVHNHPVFTDATHICSGCGYVKPKEK